ncbi:hypothetical protein HKD37_11G031680 [Glycine soja]|uniref:Uncharacterized protein n=1 Tax=Glycine soja TaxID=3848 RepID=A0A445I2W9_GLYSO|nr:hypothetical protein D0Y65_030243 [Glycine soja]
MHQPRRHQICASGITSDLDNVTRPSSTLYHRASCARSNTTARYTYNNSSSPTMAVNDTHASTKLCCSDLETQKTDLKPAYYFVVLLVD